MTTLIKRLEQALSVWENNCFTMNLVAKMMKLNPKYSSSLFAQSADKGPLGHWREFRDYLLSLRPMITMIFDYERFYLPANPIDGKYNPMFHVPQDLAAWTVYSRRVYNLTGDLTLLFGATSLKGLTWEEIHLPFNSFAITLEQPIVTAKGKAFDCILIARATDAVTMTDCINLDLFCTDLDHHKPITPAARIDMSRAFQRGQYEKLSRMIRQHGEKPGDIYFSRIPFFLGVTQTPVDMSIAELHHRSVSAIPAYQDAPKYDSEQFPEWDIAARIVLGLCMYLRSLKPKVREDHVSKWVDVASAESRAKKPDPKALSSGAEVCHVVSTIRLSDEVRDYIRANRHRPTYEICAKFVEGYWRRPMGLGHDPTAEKTNLVNPYMRGLGALQDGELPGGAVKEIKLRPKND